MKKMKIIYIALVILLLSTGLLSCVSEEPQDDNMAKVEEILERLREVDSSASLYSSTSYYKIVCSNEAGDEINFYNVKTKYYGEIKEIDGVHTDAISSVINPIFAESSRTLTIQDKDAIIYTYDGKEYLCWTISPEDSCVIEYEVGVLPEEEIIKMAESVKPTTED